MSNDEAEKAKTHLEAARKASSVNIRSRDHYIAPSKSPAIPNTPNWREWNNTPRVKVWQACALSLNINPHLAKELDAFFGSDTAHFDDHSLPNKDIRDEFDLRRRVLIANLPNNPKCFTFKGSFADGNSKVILSEFAARALSIGWDIPIELAELAPKPHTDVTEKVSPDDTATSAQDKPQKPQGRTWREIMDAPWPRQQGFNLSAALSNKIPKWLDNETAIMHRGTAPEPTLWNPAGIAICMATDAPRRKWTMPPRALDNVIRAHFPEFLQEWEAFFGDR